MHARTLLALVALGAVLTALLGGAAESSGTPHALYQPGRLKPVDSRLRVKVGQRAPEFALASVRGGVVSLRDYRGRKNVVLSFVPAAFTPVCSAQWPGYQLAADLFERHDAVLLGITVDNVPALHAWIQAMGGLDFPVLSDFHPHGATARAYGVLRRDGMSERALFVLDKQGVIRWLDVHDINERPPLEDLARALEALPR